MPSITIGSTSYDYNSQARAIGGSLPHCLNPALSFTIEEISDSKWSLRINRTDLVGLFDSRDYALGILMGLYTSHDGHEDSFSVWMNDSLTNRGSTIESTEVTLIQDDFVGTAGDIHGREPDTTSFGSEWESETTNAQYDLTGSGGAYSSVSSDTGRCVIFTGQDGDVTITATSRGEKGTNDQFMHGIVIYEAGSGATGEFERIAFTGGDSISRQTWNGSSYTRDDSLVGSLSSQLTTGDYTWTVTLSSSNTVNWEVTGGNGLSQSGTFTADNDFNGYIGFFNRDGTLGATGTHFKNYKVVDNETPYGINTPNWNEYGTYDEINILMNSDATYNKSFNGYTQFREDSDRSGGATIATTFGDVALPSAPNNRIFQGGHLDYTGIYDYVAYYEPEGLGTFGQYNTTGWVVMAKENVAGTAGSSRQSYLPIERSSIAMTSGASNEQIPQLEPGGRAFTNNSRTVSAKLIAFNGYTSGDVLGWSAP